MRNTFINVVIQECLKRDDIFIISGDAGLGVFDQFQKQRPDCFLNLGVAEQNMIGWSAGLALSGFRVYVYNIVPFVLYRCYEQVRNDICYQHLPITLVGTGSGLTYAPGGMTHYSVEDLGIVQTLPNLRVFSPADPTEAESVARFTLSGESPSYVRLAKTGELRIHSNPVLDVTKPLQLSDGKDVAIVFHGTIANEVLGARKKLEEMGVSVRLISLPQIAPLPFDYLNSMFADIGQVVTVEEHFVNCGLGSRLAFWHSMHNPGWRLNCMGIHPEFIHAVKKQNGMRDYYQISSKHISAYVQKLLGEM